MRGSLGSRDQGTIVASAKTLGELLYKAYSNLAMAHAAVSDGSNEYSRKHFAIRARLYKGLTEGTMNLGSFADDERLKMVLPRACCYCGAPDGLTLDHLLPRKVGGGDAGDNIVWACGRCNSSKGARDLVQWMGRRSEFPPLLLLRRYLKLSIQWARHADMMDTPLTELGEASLPFSVDWMSQSFPQPCELRLWSVALPD